MAQEPEGEAPQPERRKAMIVLAAQDALALMRQYGYTGCFIGHAHQGQVKRIEIPNPQGWTDRV